MWVIAYVMQALQILIWLVNAYLQVLQCAATVKFNQANNVMMEILYLQMVALAHVQYNNFTAVLRE